MRPRPIRIVVYCGLLLSGSLWTLPAVAAITAEKGAEGVVFNLDGARLRLQVWTDRVVRVTYAPGDALPDAKSLSVIAKPAHVRWEFRETPESFVVATPWVEARVDRKNGAVTLLDEKGTAYVAEAPGGRAFSPTTVKNLDAQQAEQDFVLAPDEAILGQQANGPWNYRGQTVRLLQSNMNIALPVLVSSRGYGVLWDNPAITTVAVGASGKEGLVSWTSEVARSIDYYFLAGPDLSQVVADYRVLTGIAPMLAKWVFGFWQCREHYETQTEIRPTLRTANYSRAGSSSGHSARCFACTEAARPRKCGNSTRPPMPSW